MAHVGDLGRRVTAGKRQQRSQAAARDGLGYARPRRMRWWEKVGVVFDALDVFSLFR
ncbi:hypothetical protein GCM10010988_06020 [Cnuibacter physcomitrellae]|uniref:hypothetical protein n=1 Tax=Cnuibacter physcomitrellae TaxID=1619308 RepID=UPI0012F4B82B|nr:hypothetical protein [Cnuibacter physcomitrellae]GGI35851.1 hypothetical protein GCM10010988_06020 [Cnuibacter physcomitrellae]